MYIDFLVSIFWLSLQTHQYNISTGGTLLNILSVGCNLSLLSYGLIALWQQRKFMTIAVLYSHGAFLYHNVIIVFTLLATEQLGFLSPYQN
jgi:hypothetical protein